MSKPTNAVKAVIKNDKGDILLLQRNPKNTGVANWDFPGGLIEPGEEEKDALKREVKEELDLDMEVIEKGKKWKFFRPLDSQWVDVQNYVCKIIGGEMNLSDEHIDYKWVPDGEMRNYPVKDGSFFEALN